VGLRIEGSGPMASRDMLHSCTLKRVVRITSLRVWLHSAYNYYVCMNIGLLQKVSMDRESAKCLFLDISNTSILQSFSKIVDK
jgi:hypothetical protein